MNVYYKTTTDGINWNGPFTWVINWPNPYPSNIIGWMQAVVTDAGNPILVFDNWDGNDPNYPFRSKVYVSIASGADCIDVGQSGTNVYNFYPTIAAGGNYVVALFGIVRSDTGQYTIWDIYYNYSTDNGTSWHTPQNLTGSITDHNNCLWQISKRLDPNLVRFFYVFGSSISDPMLDLYYDITVSGGITFLPAGMLAIIRSSRVLRKTIPRHQRNLLLISPLIRLSIIRLSRMPYRCQATSLSNSTVLMVVW